MDMMGRGGMNYREAAQFERERRDIYLVLSGKPLL
jgi:hypothetical protein